MTSPTSLSELIARMGEIGARVGAPVDIDWYDPDKEVPPPADGTTLVYQRAA